MQCPVCRVDLMIADRQGIEIDYCPRCRGVWLDRGELDKIIERSSVASSHGYRDDYRGGQPHHAPPAHQGGYYQQPHQQQHYHHHGHHKHKRESFLEELFDFD